MGYNELANHTPKTQMQAILAIIQSEDTKAALAGLSLLHLPCLERIASSGGFLRQNNTALWLTVREEQVGLVLQVLRRTCHRRLDTVPAYYAEEAAMIFGLPLEVEVGGATVFICDVEHFEVF